VACAPGDLLLIWQKCNMGSFGQNKTETYPTLSRQDSSPYKGANKPLRDDSMLFGTIP
jgi:hypothetical protein